MKNKVHCALLLTCNLSLSLSLFSGKPIYSSPASAPSSKIASLLFSPVEFVMMTISSSSSNNNNNNNNGNLLKVNSDYNTLLQITDLTSFSSQSYPVHPPQSSSPSLTNNDFEYALIHPSGDSLFLAFQSGLSVYSTTTASSSQTSDHQAEVALRASIPIPAWSSASARQQHVRAMAVLEQEIGDDDERYRNGGGGKDKLLAVTTDANFVALWGLQVVQQQQQQQSGLNSSHNTYTSPSATATSDIVSPAPPLSRNIKTPLKPISASSSTSIGKYSNAPPPPPTQSSSSFSPPSTSTNLLDQFGAISVRGKEHTVKVTSRGGSHSSLSEGLIPSTNGEKAIGLDVSQFVKVR